jgi:threonine dehydrogenase-like Zn-dependent dehydrogenase
MIIGAGPVGNSIIQVANILGAGRVIILDQAEIPLTLAAKAGADFILDSRELSHSEIIDLVLRTTEGVLPPSIFDTVGTKKSFDLGIRLLGKAGTYVNVAVHDLNLDVNSMSIASEKTITSSCNFDVIDYEDTLRWLEEGRIKVDDWIHRISLQDVPYIFPRLIQDQKKDIFKVCINF